MKLTRTCFHDLPEGNGQPGARAASGNKSALAGGGGGAATKDKAESAGGGPIKSAEEFEKEFMRDFVTDFDLENADSTETLSVGALRKKYAGRMSDKEFDNYMRELEDKDILRLGETSPAEKNKYPDAGGIEGMFGIKSVAHIDTSKIDKNAKPKLPTGKNPITTQKQFESEVQKAMKKMESERPRDGFYEIHEIRKYIGDNVTRSQFNRMMIKMQHGNWQLEKGNVSEASSRQVQDSVNSKSGGLRFYIRRAAS